jgi:hypothetical protein
MNIVDIESVTTELDDGLEIMRQFNLQYTVRMCAPQLIQLRRECGFKTVKMRKPDLVESMILQLYGQFPSKASAPNHGKVKGLNYARMESMAGSLISGPILTKKKIKKTRATDLSENVYKGEQLLPHSQGTSFVLGASNIQKSQELDKCDLQAPT